MVEQVEWNYTYTPSISTEYNVLTHLYCQILKLASHQQYNTLGSLSNGFRLICLRSQSKPQKQWCFFQTKCRKSVLVSYKASRKLSKSLRATHDAVVLVVDAALQGRHVARHRRHVAGCCGRGATHSLAKNLFNTQFTTILNRYSSQDYLTLGATLAIFDLSTVNWMAWAAGFVLR